MALSWRSVTKAVNLFWEITDRLSSHIVTQRTGPNQYDENKILGIDLKDDGGWESVFINVKDITPEQLAKWEAGRTKINNSSSNHEVQPGITRLYFY